jgi:tetratricopeptide (TPR) repeat protein
MKDSCRKHVIPWIFVLPLLVYLSTICPTIFFGDTGEVTAAAFSLGNPHNSGYPLYCLIGKLFCMIPIGNIGFRMNLMSTAIGVVTLWLVYSIILRMSFSKVGAFVGAMALAFAPSFWSQTVSADVYMLHAFFVALLARLLLWWDETREHYRLVIFVFVTGLSFGNHMQTVVLAPGVLWMVFSGDRKALLEIKRFAGVTVFFLAALSVYVYLPIRTEAGAAFHWGDPNSIDRFIAHVTGSAHRDVYFFNLSVGNCLLRARDALGLLWSQFWGGLIVSVYGWLTCTRRWRLFWVLIVLGDLSFTLFLNTISLEVRVFMLPTTLVLAILMGVGFGHGLERLRNSLVIGTRLETGVRATCCLLPLLALMLNYSVSNQSRNYTAYEWAMDISRTVNPGATLFLEGDNNFFPVLYCRVVERFREDLTLYDRENIAFKIPYIGKGRGNFYGNWESFRSILEKEIIKQREPDGVFYAVFELNTIRLPEKYQLVPYGLVYQVVEREKLKNPYRVENVWKYYANESFFDDFGRDYLNRQVCAHFFYRFGEYLFMARDRRGGYKYLRRAASVGYDDSGIHVLVALGFADEGFFEEARDEVEKVAIYQKDAGVVQNAWGCYFYKKTDYDKAIIAFRKATEYSPRQAQYYKNLAMALYREGRADEGNLNSRISLKLEGDQPDLIEMMRQYGQEQLPRNRIKFSGAK